MSFFQKLVIYVLTFDCDDDVAKSNTTLEICLFVKVDVVCISLEESGYPSFQTRIPRDNIDACR